MKNPANMSLLSTLKAMHASKKIPADATETYQALINTTLSVYDTFYTLIFRYPQLIAHDIMQSPNTQGWPLDVIATHPILGAVTTLIISITALYQGITDLQANLRLNKKISIENSAYYILQHLQNIQHTKQMHYQINLNEFQTYLAEYERKYPHKLIPATPPTPVTFLRRTLQIATKQLQRIISPLWSMLNISSFIYWILWVGSSLFSSTGIGITLLSPVISLGIPLILGAIYPGMKFIAWLRSPSTQIQQQSVSAQQQAVNQCIIDAAGCFLIKKQFDFAKKKLLADNARLQIIMQHSHIPLANPITSNNEQTPSSWLRKKNHLTSGMIFKIALNAIVHSIAFFAASQYVSWILSDLVQAALGMTCSLALTHWLGVGCMLVSIAYGIYKATESITHYRTIQHKIDLAQISYDVATDQAVHQQRQQIQLLTQQLMHVSHKHNCTTSLYTIPQTPRFNQANLCIESLSEPSTKPSRIKHYLANAWTFIGGMMSGVFLARLVIIKGTGIFLPFTALTFSTPISLGIMIIAGSLWGIIQLYQAKRAAKETRAETFVNQIAYRSTCLQEEYEYNQLSLQTLNLRKNKLLADTSSNYPPHSTSNGLFKETSALIAIDNLHRKQYCAAPI